MAVALFLKSLRKIVSALGIQVWYRHKICAQIAVYWLLFRQAVRFRLRLILKRMPTPDTRSKVSLLKSAISPLFHYRSIIIGSRLPHVLRYRVTMFDVLSAMPLNRLLIFERKDLFKMLLTLLLPALQTLSKDEIIDRLRPIE